MKLKINSKRKIVLIILIFLFIAGCFTQLYSTNTYYKMDKVEFYNLDEEEISARYYKGSTNMGVFIANDLSANAKDTWFMVEEFAKLGYSVYVFDYPSQGHSDGHIEFGYKQNEYLAEQYYSAIVAFSQMAKLNEENIHIVAVGESARTALQTATKRFFNPKDLTLISTKTNILGKIDLDVINFVKEENVTFMKELNASNPGENIHLITSNLNDQSSVKENEALKTRLEQGKTGSPEENEVTLTVTQNVLPTNEITSRKIIKETVSYIAQRDGYEYTPSKFLTLKTMLPAVLCIIAFFIIFLSYKIVAKDYYKEKGTIPFNKEFVISKLLAVIPSLIMVFLLPVALYFLLSPIISIPYYTLVKLSLLSCYGMIIFYLYYRTNFACDIGSQIFYKDPKKNVKGGLIVAIGIIAILYLLSVAGCNVVFNITSIKVFWLILSTILCYFIFYIEEREKEVMIATQTQRFIMSCFNFLIIPIVAIVMLIMGQFSIAISFMGLVFLLVFVLVIGKLLKAVDSPTRLNAFIQALILNALILAQTVLFF
ncbi:hypothetical protein [Anaerofustis butyriciformans]|uniref:hypothetical protein n=1 Tax=Anaerofustis butyriciformans TaxID=3108533 RepID=UPI002E37C435|nr:hypothetical protein [Anaerofustis sp. HA2171]